jgi:hypothetical protein
LVECLRLGAAHVGFEAAQPEQTRRGACALAHGDHPGRCAGSYLHGFEAIIHLLAFAIRAADSDRAVASPCFASSPH